MSQTPTNTEVYNALKTVREYCYNNKSCENCIISVKSGVTNQNACPLKNTLGGTTTFPDGWGLNRPTEDKDYKVFR